MRRNRDGVCMGYELRRWLADRLPAECTSGERLVALEIADQANDATRHAWSKDLLDTVVRRTGLTSATVSTMLARLARRGWELRVEIGKGRDGRPLYAHAGTQTTYRVPTERADPRQPFERVGGKRAEQAKQEGLTTVSPQEARPPSALSPDEDQPSGLTLVSPEGIQTSAPSPQGSPQRSPQQRRASPLEQIALDSTDATPAEAVAVVELVRQAKRDTARDFGAVFATIAAAGELPDWLNKVRADAIQATNEQARTARRAAIDACRLCDRNGMTDEDRPRRCDHRPIGPRP